MRVSPIFESLVDHPSGRPLESGPWEGAAPMDVQMTPANGAPATPWSKLFTAEFLALVRAAAAQFSTMVNQLAPAFAEHIAPVLSKPRAPAYEAFLIGIGYPATTARLLSFSVITCGERYAKEVTRDRRKLGTTMRHIVEAPQTSTLVIGRRANALLRVL